MKTPLILAVTLLALAGNIAAAGAQTALGYPTTPGYDRPAADPVHQHVVYWNDSLDHYEYSMQTAADAYSTGDLHAKRDDKPDKQYNHKKPKHK